MNLTIPPPSTPNIGREFPGDGNYKVFDISDEFLRSQDFDNYSIQHLRNKYGLGKKLDNEDIANIILGSNPYSNEINVENQIPIIFNLGKLLSQKQITRKDFYKVINGLINKILKQANEAQTDSELRSNLIKTLGIFIACSLAGKANIRDKQSKQMLNSLTRVCCYIVRTISHIDQDRGNHELLPQSMLFDFLLSYAKLTKPEEKMELSKFLHLIREPREFNHRADEGRDLAEKMQNLKKQPKAQEVKISGASSQFEAELAKGIQEVRNRIQETDIINAVRQTANTINSSQGKFNAGQYLELLGDKIQHSQKKHFILVNDSSSGYKSSAEIINHIVKEARIKSIGVEESSHLRGALGYLQTQLYKYDEAITEPRFEQFIDDFFVKKQTLSFIDFLKYRFGKNILDNLDFYEWFNPEEEFAELNCLKKIQLDNNIDINNFPIRNGTNHNKDANRFIENQKGGPKLLLTSSGLAHNYYPQTADQIFIISHKVIEQPRETDNKEKFLFNLAKQLASPIIGFDMKNPRLINDFHEFDQKKMFQSYSQQEMEVWGYQALMTHPDFQNFRFSDLTLYEESQYFDFSIVATQRDDNDDDDREFELTPDDPNGIKLQDEKLVTA